MSNIRILLIVNTRSITKGSVEQNCKFVDNSSILSPPSIPEKYITYIKPGQSIEWSGTPLDPNTMDSVSINSIHKSSKGGEYDIFGAKTLVGNAGRITASVLANARTDDDEVYTISFTVTRSDNGKSECYPIDPKIGVNPGP